MEEPLLISENIFANNKVDATELSSPIPLLRAKREIANMAKGEVIQINVTDPNSRVDFSSWCLRAKHEYLGEKRTPEGLSFYIEIK